MADKFDVIVIGSGMGGLAAAGILARLKDKRVLILEKHYVAGGQTHEFHRNQYSWDVGIHYVGGMAAGEQNRLLADLITGKQVDWNPMPDVFDRFMYPDLTVDVHKDPTKFAKTLIAAFPAEEAAIWQYIRDLKAANNWYIAHFLAKIPDALAYIQFMLRSLGKGKLARMTTRQYMNRCFKDERLKVVLTSQWGDYGLTPERCCFGLHALVVWGYNSGTGAFFPEGGGRSIAQAVERVIALKGGHIQLDTEVTNILIRDGAAYGVCARQSNGWVGEYHADTIISNVGAELTFCNLVAAQYCQAEREELTAFERGGSFLTLYLGLSESPEKLAIKGENYWIYETYDQADIDKCLDDLLKGNAKFGFLSFPSMKNNSAIAHTAELCVRIAPDGFNDWATRPHEYYQAKEKITTAMIALLERKFPGFVSIIDYAELSTPVTQERFTSRPKGESYGIPGTPARFDLKSLKPKTSVRNLFLSGSDVCSLGIVGALYGGAAAAASIMGPMGFMKIITGMHIAAGKPAPAGIDVSVRGIEGTLISKTHKTDTVIELQIKTDPKISFRAGQHIDLQVGNRERRAYSVLSLDSGVLTLIIDTSPAGVGSQYITALKPQDTVLFSEPKGRFLLLEPATPICFISTGTGMVPLVAMLKQYLEVGACDIQPKFLFGASIQRDNFLPDYLSGQAQGTDITYCLSQEAKNNKDVFEGRVTQYLASKEAKDIDFKAMDFYICGNPNMVHEVQKILREKGASRVFVEYY